MKNILLAFLLAVGSAHAATTAVTRDNTTLRIVNPDPFLFWASNTYAIQIAFSNSTLPGSLTISGEVKGTNYWSFDDSVGSYQEVLYSFDQDTHLKAVGIVVLDATAAGVGSLEWDGAHLQPNVPADNGTPTSPWQSMVASNYFGKLSTQLVATNSTANSNLTLQVNNGTVRLLNTNHVSLTNGWSAIAGTVGSAVYHFQPQGSPKNLILPTMGGAQFGVFMHTNYDGTCPIFGTLTNGIWHCVTFNWVDTNVLVTMTRWSP